MNLTTRVLIISAFIYAIYFNLARNSDVLGWNRVFRVVHHYSILVAEL